MAGASLEAPSNLLARFATFPEAGMLTADWPCSGSVFPGDGCKGDRALAGLRGGAAHPAPRKPRGVRRFLGGPPRLCECPELLSLSFSHILCMCYANGGLTCLPHAKIAVNIYMYMYIGYIYIYIYRLYIYVYRLLFSKTRMKYFQSTAYLFIMKRTKICISGPILPSSGNDFVTL